MGVHYFVCPLETFFWNEIRWENLSFEEAKKFIKERPMPKNTLYKNEKELLKDIKQARGVIAFNINEFNKEENDEFFSWFSDLVYECL